ncbi:MAG: ion transporter [bacterium]|nr:ion transporter [bacterium]
MTEKEDTPDTLDALHPGSSLREKIQFYLIDCKTIPGKLTDVFIILLNVLICVLFVIETYDISQSTLKLLLKIEILITVFFIIEYAARFYGSRNRLKYLFDIYSIFDVIAILPVLIGLFTPDTAVSLGFIRIIRVLRVFRFLRFTADPVFFFGTISTHLLKVIRLLFTIMLIFFISSGLFWFAESTQNPQVQNFGDAFYFSVVTLTTVGFGDIIPVSAGGRWVTVLMILSGIILIPWQVGLIVREWFLMTAKKEVTCPQCGLKGHDKDASHCKACGHVIYQEFSGN